ncbi:MAG: phosphoribosylanthranilate isomerase [Flavobacteriaceae bacterium]
MKLKVCGMREAQNVKALSALKPDYMGFIFWEPSKRYCQEVPKNIPDHIQKVGVFVDATLEKIETTISLNNLQAVQLHGEETPTFCQSLFSQTQVIKAFRIGPDFDFSCLRDYQPHCHYFLFDTQGPLPGGNGTAFDWRLLEKYTLDHPFFLSGGIGLESVEKITEIRRSGLPIHALDINSKFELAAAQKDISEIELFKEKLAL